MTSPWKISLDGSSTGKASRSQRSGLRVHPEIHDLRSSLYCGGDKAHVAYPTTFTFRSLTRDAPSCPRFRHLPFFVLYLPKLIQSPNERPHMPSHPLWTQDRIIQERRKPDSHAVDPRPFRSTPSYRDHPNPASVSISIDSPIYECGYPTLSP